MKFRKKTLLAVALATGPIHLAGCATIEGNIPPDLACAMSITAGGVLGGLIGDDTGAAIAGAAIGALGCALIQHLGTENAKAVEEWQVGVVPPGPMDTAFRLQETLPAINDDGTEGGTMKVRLHVSPSGKYADMGWGSNDDTSWPKEDTICREVRTGTKLREKEVVTEAKECLDDNGDFVLVTRPNTTVASI